MSLDHYDPLIEPPYFVVARHGRPAPQFVRWYRGSLNPISRLRYWLDRTMQRMRRKLLRR
jgi:hypothetical protein